MIKKCSQLSIGEKVLLQGTIYKFLGSIIKVHKFLGLNFSNKVSTWENERGEILERNTSGEYEYNPSLKYYTCI